jgi:hypothetical protein
MVEKLFFENQRDPYVLSTKISLINQLWVVFKLQSLPFTCGHKIEAPLEQTQHPLSVLKRHTAARGVLCTLAPATL